MYAIISQLHDMAGIIHHAYCDLLYCDLLEMDFTYIIQDYIALRHMIPTVPVTQP